MSIKHEDSFEVGGGKEHNPALLREVVRSWGGKSVAIYHAVYAHEDFKTAATTLFELVKGSAARCPGKKRVLFLDIDGHRNDQGGFDRDMLELQKEFVVDFLEQFLTEVHMPLGAFRMVKPQSNVFPDRLEIVEGKTDTL
jgi:hypothetical protein